MRTLASFTLIGFLVAGAAGCGRTKLSDSDDDDAPDGGDDVIEPGEVTITVLSTGSRLPMAEVPVAFFAADGELTDLVETDDDGVASADVLPGAAVAAFVTSPGALGHGGKGGFGHETRVVLDVQPGDDILLGGERFPVPPPVASMGVTLPNLGSPASYAVQTPCGFFSGIEASEGAPIVANVEFYDGCEPDSFPVVAVATEANPSHSMVIRDVELDDGGGFESSDSWQGLEDHTLDIVDLPAEVSAILVQTSAVAVGDETIGVDLGTSGVEIPPMAGDGDEELGFREMLDVDGTVLTVGVDGVLIDGGGRVGRQRWTLRTSGEDGGSREISAADLLLPWLGVAAYDVVGRSVFWSQVGDGEGDATYVRIEWFEEIKGGNFGNVIVAAPPGVTALAIPELPEDYAEWLPSNAHINNVTVTLTENSALRDWDAARQRGIDPSFAGSPQALDEDGTTTHSFSPLPIF